MAYPAKLLAPGESIVYELKPHWRGLIVPIIAFLAEVVLFTTLLLWLDNSILRWLVAAAFIVLVVLSSLVAFLRWLTTNYIFTNRRVIVRSGIITRQGRDMPLAKTNNVSFRQGLLGRILNYGDLDIDSANVEGSLIVKDVPNVEEIQRDIYRLQEEDDARRRSGDPSVTD